LGFHVGAQDGVDAGLVAFAVLLEPLHDVVVHADGEAVFYLERRGSGRVSLAVAQNDLPSLGMSEKSISESLRARRRLKSVAPLERVREVVCVVLPFIFLSSTRCALLAEIMRRRLPRIT
jgi:hypothetical protein